MHKKSRDALAVLAVLGWTLTNCGTRTAPSPVTTATTKTTATSSDEAGATSGASTQAEAGTPGEARPPGDVGTQSEARTPGNAGTATAAASAPTEDDTIRHVSLGPRFPGMELVITETNPASHMECDQYDLVLQLVRKRKVIAEEVLMGECQGACTAEEKAEGERMLAEAEAEVAAGETDSLLDYDFTGCTFYGSEIGDVEEADEDNDRAVVMLVGHKPGPHDIPNRYFRLATVRCNGIFVSSSFGDTYANRWEVGDLEITHTRDSMIVHADNGDKRLEVYRVKFADDCNTKPVETVSDAEY